MPRRKHVNIKFDGIAEKLGAEVYNESPGFICLLPADVHESVVGRGRSVVEAVNNWDDKLKAHLRNAPDDDPIVLFIKSHLAKASYAEPMRKKGKPTCTKKTQHVIDFENQFYASVKR